MDRVPSVEAECPHCGAAHVVIPPTMGQAKNPYALEVPKIELPFVGSDAYLVEADADGRWRCEVCRRESWALNST